MGILTYTIRDKTAKGALEFLQNKVEEEKNNGGGFYTEFYDALQRGEVQIEPHLRKILIKAGWPVPPQTRLEAWGINFGGIIYKLNFDRGNRTLDEFV